MSDQQKNKSAKTAREERLSQALRDNLRRRKDAQKRQPTPGGEPNSD